MRHVECIEQGTLEVREGEGKNKGVRGDGGKTWCVRGECCLILTATDDRFSPLSCISHILLRRSKASLDEGKTRKGGGRMGGRTEARERQQDAGGGGSVVASAAAVIPLLRGSAAGGCAEGRSVEKTEERSTGGKERKGVPGQHCNSCSSLSGRKRERRRQREEKGLQDCLRGSVFYISSCSRKRV